MYELLQAILTSSEKPALQELVHDWHAYGKQYLLRSEILQTLADYCQQHQKPAYFFHASALGELLHRTHEVLLDNEHTWFLIRTQIASQEVYRLSADLDQVESMPLKALLELRDRLVNRYQPHLLELDFSAFDHGSPLVSDPRHIGQGLAFLNRHLCDSLSREPRAWLEALYQSLHEHHYNGISLLINEEIDSGTKLVHQLKDAIALVRQQPAEAPFANFSAQLQTLGFESGWGYTAARTRETLELLDRLIIQPEPAILEAFLARLPRIFRVVSISIHGWVGQEEVLGRPETAGQMAYVLHQARNLEQALRQEVQLAGLDSLGIQPTVVILTRHITNCEGTSCDQRLEKVDDTENAWILRVPFQGPNPEVTHSWMSKYELWPYLESFALDAEPKLLDQLGGQPDLIIGHYSDGNLVASLLARRLNTIQCNVAHVLEKSRHLFSDLYWQDLEDQYHFSLQFTADLISMNAADFIITSSQHEILGTPDTTGQYESYKCFTLPQLYHVLDGVELRSTKFNVVPPGVDETVYFPYSDQDQRVEADRQRIDDLLFTCKDARILGHLDQLHRRPLFAIGPISANKNLAGLVECFGRSADLQARCNLILISGTLNPDDAIQVKTKQEIQQLHDLIHKYQLQGKVRWLGMRLTNKDLGEAYRVIADRGGMFVAPARFEAFGTSIVEAMSTGLPTFATQFGGPLEIIEKGKNGFHINPTDLDEMAQTMLDFVEYCATDPHYWHDISEQAIQRMQDKYRWPLHTQQLLLLAKVYSFWNQSSHKNREPLMRYLEALFHLIYTPRAAKLLGQHWHN